jgi:hypothetical protein
MSTVLDGLFEYLFCRRFHFMSFQFAMPNTAPEPTGDVRGGLFVKISDFRTRWAAGGSAWGR